MPKRKIVVFTWILIILFSCAVTPQSTSSSAHPDHSFTDRSSTTESLVRASFSSQEPAPVSPRLSLYQSRPGFTLQIPDTAWVLISDPTSDSSLLEFFHAPSNTRIAISMEKAEEKWIASPADLASAEIKGLTQSAEKMIYTHIGPLNIGPVSGMSWESAWGRPGHYRQNMGFYALTGGWLLRAELSAASDSLISQSEIHRRWENFFAGFRPDTSILQGPSMAQYPTQTYQSEDMGFSWSTSDTFWHQWTGMSPGDPDLSLALMDPNEEISLFIYATVSLSKEVQPLDLLGAFLIRQGISLSDVSPGLKRLRMRDSSVYAREFELVHLTNGYDFLYRGRFYWKNGRAALILCWTQNALTHKYIRAMDRALQGFQFNENFTSDRAENPRQTARLLNQVGLLRLADNQPLVALSFFEKANRLDPEEPLYLINCGFVYQLKNLYGPGTAHFLTQMPLVRRSGKLLHILGEMYEALRDYGNALRYYEMAMRFSPNDPELVINLSDALWGVGQRTQSLEVVRQLYVKQPSTRLGVYVAKTLMGLDQYAEAVDLLYEVRNRFPMSRELGLTLCDALIFLQRYQEALEISQELLPTLSSDWEFLTTRGKILFHLKQYAAAEAALNQALRIRPDNEDAKSYLSAVKAFLGKADTRALQTPIEPASSKPASLRNLIDLDFSARMRAEGAPAVLHRVTETLKAHKNGSWVRTEEILAEILSFQGISLFQEFNYSFLPGYDRIYVNALEVYNSQWKLKNRWSPQQAYITYFREEGSREDAQLAHLPVHNLQPGDFIYLQVSRAPIENSGTIPYVHHKASRAIPVRRDEFYLLVPDTGRYIAEDYGPVERRSVPGGQLWVTEYPVTLKQEVYTPVYRDFGAGVVVAAKQQWSQVGKDYLNMIRHQFKNSIPVREKAFELLGNRRPNTDVIYQFADWMRWNIRYRDVAFGGHSLIPAQSLTTLQNRSGDCKDQSLLLAEMLQTVGVPAYLALIHLQEPGSVSLPTVHQFNHMIVYVPPSANWPEMWLDPTDKSSGKRPIPLDLEGKVSLILHPDTPYVHITPILEKDQEHRVHLDHRLVLNQEGFAEFRDSLHLEGKFAAAMRSAMLARDEQERRKYLLEWLTQYIPDVSLTNLRLMHVERFDQPLILILTYSSAGYFSRGSGDIQGPFPNLWESSFMKLPRLQRRHHPIRLPHETFFSYRLQISAPAQMRLRIDLNTESRAPSEYTQSEFTPLQVKSQQAVYSASWKTFALYADPSEYEKIRLEWEDILKRTAPYIRLE